jgi:hypothetical protein
MKGSRQSFAPNEATEHADLQGIYGSDGLEPATSGVTGLFHRNDDWRRLTRYRSIHAGLRALTSDFRMIG